MIRFRDEDFGDDGHDFEPLDEEETLLEETGEHGLGDEDGEDDDDPALDEDFPLGDGVADTEATVVCPYCGEAVEIALDAGGGASQQYVEDCAVCCQPWRVSVSYDGEGGAYVSVAALDE
jgi:hypothetical protein